MGLCWYTIEGEKRDLAKSGTIVGWFGGLFLETELGYVAGFHSFYCSAVYLGMGTHLSTWGRGPMRQPCVKLENLNDMWDDGMYCLSVLSGSQGESGKKMM